MPKKFICKLTDSELLELYNQEGMTIKKMCSIVGCKSDITMAKLLKQAGADTNSNQKLALKKRGGKTDEEFKTFLIEEYVNKKRSMSSIGRELNISEIIVSRYLSKYNIEKRSKSEQQTAEGSATWKGGRHIANNGYVEIYVPDYHRHHRANYVYEHVYVAEQKIGRFLNDDEVVHHIDRNKTNNNPDNLLVLTKSEHSLLHIKEGELGNPKGRKKVIVG